MYEILYCRGWGGVDLSKFGNEYSVKVMATETIFNHCPLGDEVVSHMVMGTD